MGNALEEVNDVTLQTQHHALGLWVAHAAVVFDDVRFWLASRCVCAVDESEEDETLVVDAVFGQSFDGRTDNAVFYLLHPFLCGKGNG